MRSASAADGQALAAIYNQYIATTTFTFEETALTDEQMQARVTRVQAQDLPWLVAEVDGQVLGYAYAAPWRERSAYRFAVEVSAYVAPGQIGRGLGTALYAALLPRLGALGLHSALAVVPLPNPASVALYEKLGFRQVAQLVEVGFKFGRWVDVGYWQYHLAYTSKI